MSAEAGLTSLSDGGPRTNGKQRGASNWLPVPLMRLDRVRLRRLLLAMLALWQRRHAGEALPLATIFTAVALVNLLQGPLGGVAEGLASASQARILVDHDPELSGLSLCLIAILNLVGYAIFRGANSQKDAFRRDPTAPEVRHASC